MSVYWDSTDERLLACEAVRRKQRAAPSAAMQPAATTTEGEDGGGNEADAKKGLGSNNASRSEIEGENEVEIVMFFATSEYGLILQDSYPRKSPYGPLVGIQVPYAYFRSAPSSKDTDESRRVTDELESLQLYSKIMRDFVGLKDTDEAVRAALLDFSFNLSLGKLDEAYRAVRSIDSPGIWENMAQMCVKTRRLDVAEVCLGNMGHARGAAALRAAKADPNSSVESCVGVLAIQLGLLDDAAKFFREANRYDLLNKLYQAAGLWDKAITVASTQDRIHLKTTHYHYAKHLESIGEVDTAIKHFELSGTFRTEVPRMLYTLGQVSP